jgi:zinc protease
MKPPRLLALPFLLCTLLGTPGAPLLAQQSTSASSLPRIAYEKYELPNGLDVILVQDKKLPVVAVNIWYHVGPANEAPGLTGFAHLFEHMMFAGTRHAPRGLVDKLMEGAGATDSNGTTDFDRTNYFDTVPSNQLELALWAHSDRMGYLLDVLDQTALSNQQDVVRNERRQAVENRPYGIVEETIFHQLFPKTHPYHAMVIGSHADIQNAKLDDIRQFFKRYYRPNNASLVIAGDIDKARTKALVAKYFGTFKAGAPVPRPAVETPRITAERRAVVTDRIELPRVYMAWLTPTAYAAGDAELAVAAQILGVGKSSRLYKSLVYDKQIAQEVSASQNSLQLSSIFMVDVTARPGHTADALEAAVDAELRALAADGPSDKEVERARNTIETALLSSVEKLGGMGLANTLNQYNYYVGDPGYLAKDLERVRKVTAADVKRVINEHLRRNERVVVHGVPGEQKLAAEVPTPPPPKAGKAKAMAMGPDEAWRKRIPKPGPAPAIRLPAGESFKLPNGLTVIHHHNPALPLVSAELVVRSGLESNPLDQPGLAGFTANLLEEGTSTRNAQQIADEVAQLGAFLDAKSGTDSSSASLYALKANFPQALEILSDIVLRPAFPEAEVERQRASRLGELSQQRENPGIVAAKAANRALYGDRHPYGYGEIGTEAAIRAAKRDTLHGFWQRNYVPANAALVVSGDITLDELRKLAEQRFGSWQAGTAPQPVQAQPATTAARLVLVDKPGAQQTAVRVTTLGPDRRTPDYPALQVMNAALGGLFTSRINNNLREEKGYTYGVYSQFQYRRGPGPFTVAGDVRTDVTGASVSEILREVKDMRDKPMPAKELNNVRNSLMLSLPGQFDTNRSVGTSLANTFVYGLPLDYYRTLPEHFAKVTAATAQSMAQRYLDPGKLIVIAVGDRAKVEPQLEPLKLGAPEVRNADGEASGK